MKRICSLVVAALFAMRGITCAQVSLPLKKLRVTSSFGNRIHPLTGKDCFHEGVDLRAQRDTVYAAFSGRVVSIGYHPLIGIFIKIQNGPFCAIYGHLSMCLVATGDSLAGGVPIAISGATGRVTAEHLHFSIRYYNWYINPLNFLSAALKNQKTINH
ncbi:M23 family metallopeptidase [Mucilaginibacter rubeus]|uniref:M23 family metallopeptidase n=1 Tax=Mucilaginibacter rubeus TaxID=2027860 RepID=A0AAE6MHJ6_9SPHI|nr:MULTISPECIES: M23 family metallopeptidase [Mucilaginibacter]QEM03695.1 M23 family metallopeptidase [Mucilaginibacter rubeus]QEM16306.1 M23 family metallopeptidase [Mucilaginibacter gossypii]QTE40931.1 M23 family metallopeptidase [Mucilaginibacter rubeus]QTE47534.1 M23 family metallopeptidase [Mucilaginibacter rubeus]QTE58926.1 M23 family metallopeptidase [Mucilaginibacter rubeus]